MGYKTTDSINTKVNKNMEETCEQSLVSSFEEVVAFKKAVAGSMNDVYLLLVYLVTAFVPSLTACLDSSPGRCSRTAVCISRLVMVCFLL